MIDGVEDLERSGAPAGLEDVRTLVNSWHVPNDVRVPRDDLSSWLSDARRWNEGFASIPYPRRGGQGQRIRIVRDAVRQLLDGESGPFDELVAAQPPAMAICDGHLVFTPTADPANHVLALVLDAAARGTLTRLRTCGDCGWAFYDSSRNNRRRWCAMAPSPQGRGCGAAAKARAYRARVSLVM